MWKHNFQNKQTYTIFYSTLHLLVHNYSIYPVTDSRQSCMRQLHELFKKLMLSHCTHSVRAILSIQTQISKKQPLNKWRCDLYITLPLMVSIYIEMAWVVFVRIENKFGEPNLLFVMRIEYWRGNANSTLQPNVSFIFIENTTIRLHKQKLLSLTSTHLSYSKNLTWPPCRNTERYSHRAYYTCVPKYLNVPIYYTEQLYSNNLYAYCLAIRGKKQSCCMFNRMSLTSARFSTRFHEFHSNTRCMFALKYIK